MFILASLPSPKMSCIGTIVVWEIDDKAALVIAHQMSSSFDTERYFNTCNDSETKQVIKAEQLQYKFRFDVCNSQ